MTEGVTGPSFADARLRFDRRIERSALVPGLDFDVLGCFAQIVDQHDAPAALQDWLREGSATPCSLAAPPRLSGHAHAAAHAPRA